MRNPSGGSRHSPRRELLARFLGAVMVAASALQAFHWLRYSLLPLDLGAGVVRMLWLGVVLLAGLMAALVPHRATAMALALSALTLLPLAAWPLSLLFFALLPLSLAEPGRGRALWGLFSLMAVPCLVLAANERIYGPWTEEAVAAVMQTRPREALDYLHQLWTPGLLLAWGSYGVALGWALLRPPWDPAGGNWRRSAWALALPLGLLLGLPGLAERAVVVKNAWRKAPSEAALLAPAPAGPSVAANLRDLDVVVLLGEATARAYWSLYGFPVPTTPHLSAMDPGELLVFSDVVSTHSHTVPSLQGMFYRETPARPPDQAPRLVSLVDVLKQAGAEVHWYSGQETMGPWALPVTRLAESADRWGFFNQHSGFGFMGPAAGPHPDRQTQSALHRSLIEPGRRPRLLVQHFYAAHSPYCGHQPTEPLVTGWPWGEAYFGDGPDFSRELACYLDAVRWVDELVADTLALARQQTRPTIVLFVPDHGEAPDLGTGHNSQRHSARHVEVPMLAYVNSAARQQQPALWQRLTSQRDRPLLVQGLFELTLDLFGLSGDGLVLQGSSPASKQGAVTSRVLFPEDRRWDYDRREPSRRMDLLSDTRLALQAVRRETSFQAPIFAHRVNTVGKALAARDLFGGIEMDIVFEPDKDRLQVYHPPRLPVGLSLDDQLLALQARPGLQLWLDMKNPDEANTSAILTRLDELDRRWALRARTVVELPAGLPAAVFRAYTERGWRVSMYLPDDLAQCNARSTADSAGCQQRARQWLELAQDVNLRFLSFDFGSWPAVERYLVPGLGPDLGLLSWDLSLRSDRPDLVHRFRHLPPISGMIIPFPTPFDR